MSDIVERLRAPLGVMKCEVSSGPAPENKLERRWLVALEAADEITRLRAQNAELLEALRDIAGRKSYGETAAAISAAAIARAAIAKAGESNDR